MSVSSASPPTARRLPSEPVMRGALVALGVMSLLIGLYQAVAPASFVHDIGPFGEPNGHYVRDVATWYLAFGAVLPFAAARPSWRVPLLVLGIAQGALHLVNHVVDVGEADPVGVGVFNAVSLAAVLALMVWLLAGARSAER